MIAEIGLVVAIVLAASIWPLHAPPIGLHGEAREALVVRTIVRTGRWILPERNGELPSKPPLFHWIAASAARVAGLSDAVVRLPSALAAAVVVATTFGLGLAIGGRAMAWLATAALLGMLTFWEAASEARVDMVFAAAITVALAGFFLWYRDPRAAPWARAASYLGMACAVLAKGPAGLVVPGLVIVAFLAWEGRPAALFRFWSWPLVGLVLAIDVGWYALAYRAGGDEFLATQLLKENVYRFVGHGSYHESGGRFAFLRMERTLVTSLLPWNLALVLAAIRGWHGQRTDQVDRFLHAWWLAILLFFTLSSGKRPVYLLPLQPAIALLAGRALQGFWARASQEGLLWHGMRVSTCLVALLAMADVGAWGGALLLRHHQSGLRSLAPFAEQVKGELPENARVYAGMALPVPQVLILSYALDRRLERRKLTCTGSGDYFFVLKRPEGALASSNLRHAPVSLVRDGGPCPVSTRQARAGEASP